MPMSTNISKMELKLSGVKEFQDLRMMMQKMISQGFRTESNSSSNHHNKLLRAMVEPVQQAANSKTQWVIRTALEQTDTNYLYRAYELSALSDNRVAMYPLIVMQLLEKRGESATAPRIENEMGDYLVQSEPAKEYKLNNTLESMYRQGLLETVQVGYSTQYRLVDGLPETLVSPENLKHLRRLNMLVSLFAERLMPQSWGYHVQSTLTSILAQHGDDLQECQHFPLLKRDARPGMILDDEIMWDLLSAYACGNWVQVEFLYPGTNHKEYSCPMQPLFIQTNPGEGRSYLAAWCREDDGKESRPVILPLDTIMKVHLLRDTDGLRSPEECEAYCERWFDGSFSGLSPAKRHVDGGPAPLTEVIVYWNRPEDLDDKQWEQVVPKLRHYRMERVGETPLYKCSYDVTRPEDLEALLLKREKYIDALETPASAYGYAWAERREAWRQYQALTPYPHVETILPRKQTTLEPEWEEEGTQLFDPRYNFFVQDTIRTVNRWIRNPEADSEERLVRNFLDHDRKRYGLLCHEETFEDEQGKQCERYVPNGKCMIPVRMSWQEMDWLEAFLQDPFVRSMMDPGYCEEFSSYLRQQLEKVQDKRYCRRFNTNFCRLNKRLGFGRDQSALKIMEPIVTALLNGQCLEVENVIYGGTVRSSKGLPVRLEYMPGSEKMKLVMYDLEEKKFFHLRCANLRQVALYQPLDADKREVCENDFQEYLDTTRRSCTLWISNDLSFRTRAVGIVQPYLKTMTEDSYGMISMTLEFHTFERFHLARILTLLAPGAILSESDDEKLKSLYQNNLTDPIQ